MARLTAREIGRIESTYRSDLGQLTWAWVLKPDGRVLYRLSHINGRPERNYWRMVYQLSATERWEVGSDSGQATGLLARLARERGHHPATNHH
ncbi:MAG: hypothetical protein ACHQCE_12535 [Streptosporangiales bacterium]